MKVRKKMPKLFKRYNIKFLAITFLFAIVLPNLANGLNVATAQKEIWLLTVINFIFAFLSGRYLKRNYLSWWLVWVFPVFFTLGNLIWQTNNHQYAYYFALCYLILTILGRFSGLVNDDDSGDTIPELVDGGFRTHNE